MSALKRKTGDRNKSPLPSKSPEKLKMTSTNKLEYIPKTNQNLIQSPKKFESLQFDSTVQNLKKNRQNLCTCFQIFQILYENDVPQRCTVHNNFVTLYCQNQKKLLCVNCIYGTTIHSKHSVIPVKNAFKDIAKDNQKMHKQIFYEIQKLKKIEKELSQVNMTLQNQINQLLDQVRSQYEKSLSLLQQKYNNAKSLINNIFNQNKKKNDNLITQINWLRTTYAEREISLPKSSEQRSEIYSHLILNALLEYQTSNISIPKGINQETINNQTVNQFIKIRQFLESDVKQKPRLF